MQQFPKRLPAGFRPAEPADAQAMAELVNMAGEGLPYHLWQRQAQGGESPWQVGMARAQRSHGAFTYRNTVVWETQGRVAAAMTGYPLADHAPQSDYRAMPAMFVPMQQLEDLAPGTWYLNVLAVYPQFRGQGVGRRFLAIADEFARVNAKAGISIIVADANTSAHALYHRDGFCEFARRPIVKEDWAHPGRDWILLTRPVRQTGL